MNTPDTRETQPAIIAFYRCPGGINQAGNLSGEHALQQLFVGVEPDTSKFCTVHNINAELAGSRPVGSDSPVTPPFAE